MKMTGYLRCHRVSQSMEEAAADRRRRSDATMKRNLDRPDQQASWVLRRTRLPNSKGRDQVQLPTFLSMMIPVFAPLDGGGKANR